MALSPESPLHGHCACGSVRFNVTAAFESARYCHCHRCQHRTGTSSAANAKLAVNAFEIAQGKEKLRRWEPEDGQAKWYCVDCGGHVFSRPPGGDHVFVRMGALDGDPGIRPQYRQWVSSAVSWETIPDDGLPRYEEAGPG